MERRRPDPQALDPCCPMKLIEDMGQYDLRPPGSRSSRGRSGATMMDDGRNSPKKRRMVDGTRDHDLARQCDATQSGPAFRDDRSHVGATNRLEQKPGRSLRIGVRHAAKTDIDGLGSGGEEIF